MVGCLSPLIQADDPLGGGHGVRRGVHRYHLRLDRCESQISSTRAHQGSSPSPPLSSTGSPWRGFIVTTSTRTTIVYNRAGKR